MIDVPALALRSYRDVRCAPQQVAVHDDLLLTDAFRLPRRPYLLHTSMRDVDARFARLARRWPADPVRLEGAYYYLDDEHPAMYGHLLTDMIGRLWGWDDALAREPDLKLLISTLPSAGGVLPAWMSPVLEAFGIGADRVQTLTGPAVVERLHAAVPQFVNFRWGYAAPGVRAVWERIRDGALGSGPATETPSRIFVTRPRGGTRECLNADEVEAWFEGAGFTVVRPEEHDLRTQVALFSGADRIAGFGGTAMLNAVFRGRDRRMLVLQPATHHAINEFHISTVYGDDLDHVYSDPVPGTPASGLDRYHARFVVDMEAERAAFERFIEG